MSNPSYMNIRFETLQQAQEDLGMACTAVQATIDDLETKLQSNLASWSGSAQTAYVGVKAKWDSAVADMAAVLGKAKVHMGNAAQMYQAVENQNTSIWHS